MDANSMTVIQTAALSGQSASSVVSLITDFLSETACRLPPIRDSLDVQISSTLQELSTRASWNKGDGEGEGGRGLSVFEQAFATGLLNFVAGGWTQAICPGATVFLKNFVRGGGAREGRTDITPFCVLQGGLNSGLKSCNILAVNDGINVQPQTMTND